MSLGRFVHSKWIVVENLIFWYVLVISCLIYTLDFDFLRVQVVVSNTKNHAKLLAHVCLKIPVATSSNLWWLQNKKTASSWVICKYWILITYVLQATGPHQHFPLHHLLDSCFVSLSHPWWLGKLRALHKDSPSPCSDENGLLGYHEPSTLPQLEGLFSNHLCQSANENNYK